MVVIKANKESEAGIMPDEKFFGAMMKYNEELVKAGVMLAGEGLHPSSNAKRVKFSPGVPPVVIDGPFAETKELIAGFWLWKVNSMDEAVEWIKKCPSPDNAGDGEMEIRQVFELDEFGSELSPEVKEQEQRLRAQIEDQGGLTAHCAGEVESSR